jgi:hypothetical protein
MPITGLSERRWLPRLGIIRLGRRTQGQGDTEYPEASDFFICPPEVRAIYGEEPKQLKIMFTSDSIEEIAPQWLRCYSHSQGLICKGDACACTRKVDIDPKTGVMGNWANRDTKEWRWTERECDPLHCEKYGSQQHQCKKVMSLVFMLPDVPGLGVYQINTSSFYSIMNINGSIGEGVQNEDEPEKSVPPGFIRKVTYMISGKPRVCWLPLTLSLVEQPVNPQGRGRKIVHVLNLSGEVKLADLVASARKTLTQILLPELDESAPDDLFPPGMLAAADGEVRQIEVSTEKAVSSTAKVVSSTEQAVPVTEKAVPSTENAEPVTRKAVAVNCDCPKPVPADEVVTRDHSCYHTKCAGYLCTSPIDCFPGCPHTPLETPAATGKLPPGWDKVTREQVPDYLELEKVWCQLNPGKSTREMYRRLGIGSRTDATIKAWDAFLTLKETAKEPQN